MVLRQSLRRFICSRNFAGSFGTSCPLVACFNDPQTLAAKSAFPNTTIRPRKTLGNQERRLLL